MRDDCTYVIFGATGNLARIKLIPALYQLDAKGLLSASTRIVATGRRDWDTTRLHAELEQWLSDKLAERLDSSVLERFKQRISYFRGDLVDDATWPALHDFLNSADLPRNIAYYMSIRPAEFSLVIASLGRVGLLKQDDGWRRVVIEKPFGYDLESARSLQQAITRHLDEEQIYRIDHYLGKGTVQNVLVFRFANTMLEPLWTRNYIEHIQITHSESLGVGTRAAYYDGSGAMRDMIQSHLLQLLTLVAMEPPASMDAESLRDEKVKVLKSLRPIEPSAVDAHAYRAQYASGHIDGTDVPGYLQESGVPDGSTTETYAAMKLYVDNWRWRGVPIYLRTGKRMAERQSLISICFRHPPQQFFRGTSASQLKQNWVLLGIQPQDCMRMEMTVKQPGLDMRTRQTSLDASFRRGDETRIDAYEELLLDVIDGDRSLFLRYDEVEHAWRVVDPVIRHWADTPGPLTQYAAGTWGPEECRRLFEKPEQQWRHTLRPIDDSEKGSLC